MPFEPGKYDDLCTEIRQKAKAQGAIVIIMEGKRGNGFSCQGPPQLVLSLPRILRFMAAELEVSIKEGKV